MNGHSQSVECCSAVSKERSHVEAGSASEVAGAERGVDSGPVLLGR